MLGASSIIIKLDPFHATFMECMMCFHSCFVSNLFGFLCNLTLSQHTLKLLIYTCSCYLSHCFTSKHNKVFIRVFQSHNHILLQSFRNSELWKLVTFIISKKKKKALSLENKKVLQIDKRCRIWKMVPITWILCSSRLVSL